MDFEGAEYSRESLHAKFLRLHPQPVIPILLTRKHLILLINAACKAKKEMRTHISAMGIKTVHADMIINQGYIVHRRHRGVGSSSSLSSATNKLRSYNPYINHPQLLLWSQHLTMKNFSLEQYQIYLYSHPPHLRPISIIRTRRTALFTNDSPPSSPHQRSLATTPASVAAGAETTLQPGPCSQLNEVGVRSATSAQPYHTPFSSSSSSSSLFSAVNDDSHTSDDEEDSEQEEENGVVRKVKSSRHKSQLKHNDNGQESNTEPTNPVLKVNWSSTTTTKIVTYPSSPSPSPRKPLKPHKLDPAHELMLSPHRSPVLSSPPSPTATTLKKLSIRRGNSTTLRNFHASSDGGTAQVHQRK